MFLDNIDKKYMIFYMPQDSFDQPDTITHDLDNTSGETLISDGATLTCKEQLGYHS